MSLQLPNRLQPREVHASFNSVYMPVTAELVANSRSSDSKHLVIMQHALRDTAFFVKELLKRGFSIGAFLAKPNSIEEEHIDAISQLGVHVLREPPGGRPYQWYEGTRVLDEVVASSVDEARRRGQRAVFVDVGGYFAGPLRHAPTALIPYIAGVVEVTTFGHRRYEALAADMPVPVVSIARSPLKEAEAIYVGETVVQATEDMLRDAGRVLLGKTCGLIGYGMIGANIASALRNRGVAISVADTDPLRALHAALEGFPVKSTKDLLDSAQVIFSATGSQTVSVGDLISMNRSDVMLVSGGSRANEFDVEGIKELGRMTPRSLDLSEYDLPNGKKVILANSGKAANFLKSGTPEEIMDIVFAELFSCIECIGEELGSLGLVNELSDERRGQIARRWLEFR
jgi:adenosylhomocysteinase